MRAFPALIHGPRAGAAGEILADPTLAACFFHPTRKAAVPCDACGRFLCALCDCELDSRHLCPSCLSEGKKKGRLDALRVRHTRFDNMAFLLTVVPPFTLIGAYFTFFTASAALWLVVAKWRTPRQALLPYNRWRFVVAGLLALAQLVGWAMVIYFIFLATRFRR